MLSDSCPVCRSVCLSVCYVGVLWPKVVRWIKMKLGTEAGLGPGHIVLDGDPAPLPKKGRGTAAPKFSAHVYCGHTARWIKMPLGT